MINLCWFLWYTLGCFILLFFTHAHSVCIWLSSLTRYYCLSQRIYKECGQRSVRTEVHSDTSRANDKRIYCEGGNIWHPNCADINSKRGDVKRRDSKYFWFRTYQIHYTKTLYFYAYWSPLPFFRLWTGKYISWLLLGVYTILHLSLIHI